MQRVNGADNNQTRRMELHIKVLQKKGTAFYNQFSCTLRNLHLKEAEIVEMETQLLRADIWK